MYLRDGDLTRQASKAAQPRLENSQTGFESPTTALNQSKARKLRQRGPSLIRLRGRGTKS
jgi:hypothetical protein